MGAAYIAASMASSIAGYAVLRIMVESGAYGTPKLLSCMMLSVA
ncbi:hypothetical protein [Pyrolobus fumarii]|nr:hypothetical protein [Pyrolobus fumarii]